MAHAPHTPDSNSARSLLLKLCLVASALPDTALKRYFYIAVSNERCDGYDRTEARPHAAEARTEQDEKHVYIGLNMARNGVTKNSTGGEAE